MVEMACPAHLRLERYLAQELDPATTAWVKQHVESCDTCRRVVHDLSRNASLERRLSGAGERFREIRGDDLPDRIGPFRVLREIGRGGMGVVLLAEQESPRRLVALKVMHPFGSTRHALARFELEVDTLGRLKHPTIAAIHDAGVATVRGERLPYFAMEYVEGTTLDTRLSEVDTPLAKRLGWFLQVADAVQAAHRIGVLHRDIKPSNVMIAQDEEVKVIDFGLARALGDDRGMRTRSGMVVGTLATMAPEQAEQRDVDTRTDVYGLGALLYILLCGRSPVPVHDCSFKEALDRIHNQDPSPPSAFVPNVERPLDWIALRALEKDKDQRYPSVDALIADVRAFMAHEPVAAAPRSWAYRLRLLARRHKVELVAACLLVLSLTAGLTATLVSLGHEARARAAATGQASVAEQVRKLLVSVFEEADPANTLGEARTPLEFVQIGTERVMRHAPLVAEIRAPLMESLARVLRSLGDIPRAEELLRDALAMRLEMPDGNRVDTLLCQEQLGMTLIHANRAQEALVLLEEAIDGLREELGADDPLLASPCASLGQAFMLLQRGDDAAKAFEESARLAGESWSDLPVAYRLYQDREMDRAVPALRECIARRLRDGVRAHEIPIARALIGHALLRSGQLKEAEVELVPAVEELARIYHESHPHYLQGLSFLAELRYEQGDLGSCESLNHRIMEVARDANGERTHLSWATQAKLGGILRERGRLNEAEEFLVESLSALEKFGSHDRGLAIARHELGRLYKAQGKLSDAATMLQLALDSWHESEKTSQSVRAWFAFDLGVCCAEMGDFTRSRDALLAEFDRVSGHVTSEPEFVVSYSSQLASAHLFLGEEEKMLGALTPAMSLAAELPDTSDLAQKYRHLLAYALDRQGEYARALPLLERVVAGRRETLGSTALETLRAENGVARLLGKTGRISEAEAWFADSIERTIATLGQNSDEVGYYRFRYAGFLVDQLRLIEARDVLVLAAAELAPGEPTHGDLRSLLDRVEKSIAAIEQG